MNEKTPPRVNDVVMQRTLNDIYDTLNWLLRRVPESAPEGTDLPAAGKLRVVFDGTGYYVEVQHEHGWVRSAVGAFIQKEKT